MEEEKKEETKKTNFHEKIIKSTEEAIESIVEDGIQPSDVEMLDKLIDIHKDICEEKYWKRKENMYMNYGNYGNYGRRAGYDSYGRGNYGEYNGYDNYGRRGYDAKYRGHDSLDRMYDYYGRYEDGHQRYGANEDTKKSLEYMLRSMEEFAQMLKEDAQSQEEVMMIKQSAQRIANM